MDRSERLPIDRARLYRRFAQLCVCAVERCRGKYRECDNGRQWPNGICALGGSIVQRPVQF